MWSGKFGFFDYKYDIPGYTGQDFGGAAHWVYLAVSFVLLFAVLIFLRKMPREKVRRLLCGIGLFMTLFYIGKTTWETIHDVRHFGAFNVGLLPLDTCSLIMPAALLAGFGRGKMSHCAACWLSSGGILGGVGAMPFLSAFKYYPFFSFGAFYSMLWHLIMLFTGLLLVVTGYLDLKPSLPLRGFVFHLAFSLVVIPIDYIFGWDYMMYRSLSSIPIFSDIGPRLIEKGLGALNPLMMLALYFGCFFVIFGILWAAKTLIGKAKGKAVA